MKTGSWLSALGFVSWGVAVVGALLWARGRDPFERRWFAIKAEGGVKAACVAVLPKTAARPWPVVVYLHGSGGSLLSDGNDLRQMAEMGLAAVGMDYCQTNDAVCEAQFAALLAYLQRQQWADTNAVAWVGFSLGAEKVTRFWLEHPEARPQLLVRLAGGGMEKSEGKKKMADGRWQDGATSDIQHSTFNAEETGFAFVCDPATRERQRVLLVHGDQDEVFPVAEACGMEAVFRTNGVPVALKLLAGQPHNLGANRALVFRAIGESCLMQLRGQEALMHYRSIGTWQGGSWPLWVCWLPALAWGGGWVMWGRTRRNQAGRLRAERWMRWVASVLALAAAGLTGLHLVTPRLSCTETALAVARRFLVSPQARADFEWLASRPRWDGQRLGMLLQHAELARYNRRLVNWKLDEATYREFVLSPVIGVAEGEDLGWRRALWESLYPRIRKEQAVGAAAEIVVRHLRERVTIADGDSWPHDVADIWRRQITDAAGFQRLTVAGLRSVGIPARLGAAARTEMWVEGKWQAAPAPVVGQMNGAQGSPLVAKSFARVACMNAPSLERGRRAPRHPWPAR